MEKEAFDLHVLGTPPAFVLSQDQTLIFFLKMSFLSFSSKTFFELSQIYCLRIDFAFVWDFYIPHTFSETLFSFQGTTVVM